MNTLSDMGKAIDLGWRALRTGGGPKDRCRGFCECDPDVGARPCQYCALYRALTAADELLRIITSMEKAIVIALDLSH